VSLTITYDAEKKTARIDGCLGLSSVEPAAVKSGGGAALASGAVCLHQPRGAALAEWPVAAGQVMADTRTAALAAAFAPYAAWARIDFLLRVKDADGNLLGAGLCPVVNSCGDHEGADGFPASGGPLVLEASANIAAGCPCKIDNGLAAPCAAGDAEHFAGIALAAAQAGDTVQVCRWGAAHVANWGLTPGRRYYLPDSGQALSSSPGNIELCAGYAQDADTLVLTGGRVVVQPRAPGSPGVWLLARDPQSGRLVETRAATFMQSALAELLADLQPLADPTDLEAIERINALLARLRGG